MKTKELAAVLLLMTGAVLSYGTVWADPLNGANSPGQPAHAVEPKAAATDATSVASPASIQSAVPLSPQEALSVKQEAKEALAQKAFAYTPGVLTDPFIPFIKAPEPPPAEVPASEDEESLPPEMPRPLTPLQKMNIGEIEKGLTAIVWGELGRKAVIQDSAGKGYIVGVGTPAAGSTGVITQIFEDRLVIQQQVWDRKLKRTVPKNEVVKLRKPAEG